MDIAEPRITRFQMNIFPAQRTQLGIRSQTAIWSNGREIPEEFWSGGKVQFFLVCDDTLVPFLA